MIDLSVIEETVALACRADAVLEALLHPNALEIAELRAAAVAEHRIKALYPFSIEAYRPAVCKLTDAQGFTYTTKLAVNGLYISGALDILPDDVYHAVKAEFTLTDPFDLTRPHEFFFARGQLLELATFVHHLAACEASSQLADEQSVANDFNSDWMVNDRWLELRKKLEQVHEVLTQLVVI